MTDATFTVQLLPIDDVRPYEANPRINDDAVDAVATSLKEFGFRHVRPAHADLWRLRRCGQLATD